VLRDDVLIPGARRLAQGHGSRPASGVRTDIQGLRAVAVVVVVLDHMLKWPTGGYVGVDVFFVISGFLITGLLLREHDRHGRVSFVDFYRRRIRRILPVAVLALSVTTLATFLVYGIGRTKGVLIDVIFSLSFAANWHFAAVGTDYMQARGPISPVQHFWSLAVEEQFYIVWPVVIALILGASARFFSWGRERALKVLSVALLVAIIISFGYACWQSRAEPTWAYFSTFSRGWELGIGALLAITTRRLSGLPDRLRPLMAWIGMGAITASVLMLDSHSTFPAPWGAVPVLGTAMVIAAGTGQARTSALLALPPLQYVGKISYSLYLWHFPVIILATSLSPQPGAWPVVVLQSACMLALSIASFHFVEDPLRKSNWLSGSTHVDPRTAKRRSASSLRRVAAAGLTPVGVALVLALTMGAVVPTGEGSEPPITELAVNPLLRAEQIRNSADAKTWPSLTPSVDDLGPASWVPEWRTDRCQDVWEDNVNRCTYGDPKAAKTAVVIGDSIAVSYVPGIRAALEGRGWKIQLLTLQQCPAINVSVLKNRGVDGKAPPYPECDRHHEWTMRYVEQTRPDLIIMSSTRESINRLVSGAEGGAAAQEWSQDVTKTIAKFATQARRVVLLGPPPIGVNLQACATKVNLPKDCTATRTEQTEVQQSTELAAIKGWSNVSGVDTSSWFCDTDNRCPAFVEGTPVFADGGHLTERFSRMLGPVLRRALDS
jgi:peptidoglycan/LPS O-acetylase OafA/YrhL